MKFKLLESVVLEVDLPAIGFAKGDQGTVVELYQPDGLEVEVFNADGSTRDVFTLRASPLRRTTDAETKSPRPTRRR
jgi:fructose-1-phosphate kinase PfkB-like protein